MTRLTRLAAVALTALLVGVATPAFAAQQPLPVQPPPAGMPVGVPPAATETPATLPAPGPAVWPFGETWSHTEGTGLLRDGADFWTDYVYDDHGATSLQGLPLGAASINSTLAPTQGAYSYASGAADGNGADIFRTATGVTATDSYWRVDWNTLADPKVPIAEWVFDTDDNAATGVSAWPASAGVTSPGIDEALVVSGTAAYLVNATTGATTDVTSGLTVDTNARSFVVRIPRSVLPVSGSWRVRMGAGVADATGRAFAMPASENAASLPTSAARLYNVTYRSYQQEPPVYTDGMTDALATSLGSLLTAQQISFLGADGLTRFVSGNFWDEDHQADALATGDVSAFSEVLDWSSLAAKASTPEPQPTGSTTRWYVSSLDLGQGSIANPATSPQGDLRPNLLGRVQPYSVYVPTGVDTSKPTPLTWVLHSLAVNYNQYASYDPTYLQQACQARGNICATTEGFGPDGWYFDEAEVDFWQVWRSLASAYTLDPTRTTLTGYSMGGWAGYKLGLSHPDLFRQVLSLEGPPTCGVQVASTARVPAGSGHCDQDGVSAPMLVNARWLPYAITAGAVDELVPVTSTLLQVQAIEQLGYRVHFEFYPTEDHLVYATQDRFAPLTAQLGSSPAEVDPGHVTYAWYPDTTSAALGIGATSAYWVSGLAAADTTPGKVATVDATSGAIPDAAVTPVTATSTSTAGPTPAEVTDVTWKLGAKPTAAQTLSLHLTDVSALTVDPVRAGLTCATVTTVSDGPGVLHIGSQPVAYASGTTVASFCPAGKGAAKVVHKVAKKPARTRAVAAPTGTLAYTGGEPVLALAGVIALAGAAVLRRRRSR